MGIKMIAETMGVSEDILRKCQTQLRKTVLGISFWFFFSYMFISFGSCIMGHLQLSHGLLCLSACSHVVASLLT